MSDSESRGIGRKSVQGASLRVNWTEAFPVSPMRLMGTAFGADTPQRKLISRHIRKDGDQRYNA